MCDDDVGQNELLGGNVGRGILAYGGTSAGLPNLPVPNVPDTDKWHFTEVCRDCPDDHIDFGDSQDDWGECPASPSADELFRAYNGGRGSPFPLRAAPVPCTLPAQQAQDPRPSTLPSRQEATRVSFGAHFIRCTDHGGVKKYSVKDVFQAAGVLKPSEAIRRFVSRKDIAPHVAGIYFIPTSCGKALYCSKEGLCTFTQKYQRNAKGRNKTLNFGQIIAAL